MNKTLVQFRTTAELIFILTKWGAKEKKKKKNFTDQKKYGFTREWKKSQDKAFSFQESE